MQLYSNFPPGIRSIRIEHAMNPKEKNPIKNIADDGFSILNYKWNGIFKKNKIEHNEVNNCPGVIEENRNETLWIISNSIKQTHETITNSKP